MSAELTITPGQLYQLLATHFFTQAPKSSKQDITSLPEHLFST